MEFLRRTWAEIDVSALKHNLKILENTSKESSICAVVKANAYGHSDSIVAPVLCKAGVNLFAVSNIEEALHLRAIGIDKPILILGYTPAALAGTLAEHNISQCVFSLSYANELSRFAVSKGVTVKVHIKLDTGMGRIGFDLRSNDLSEIDLAISAAKLQGFEFEGLFTHFAFSDRNETEEDGFTDEQYARFEHAVKRFEEAGLKAKFNHCRNSAAMLKDSRKQLDLSRAGICLYGLTPSSELTLKEDFIPVMTLKSVVSQVKTIHKGDTVSYGRTFEAEKDMTVATVSAGYADGYPRLLSNKGYVLINGKKAHILGRVCMDQFVVDITDIDNVATDSEVILFGKDLPVEEIAGLCGTINYEIICGVSPRVPRIEVNE
ncbi:MAG: alanine racemase [Clostridia bacterium]|nr:alanine racemase [Clostridia bacterium]